MGGKQTLISLSWGLQLSRKDRHQPGSPRGPVRETRGGPSALLNPHPVPTAAKEMTHDKPPGDAPSVPYLWAGVRRLNKKNVHELLLASGWGLMLSKWQLLLLFSLLPWSLTKVIQSEISQKEENEYL